MAFGIGGAGPASIVGSYSPRGNNRGAIMQSVKGIQGGLPMYENQYDESRLNADSQYEIGMAPTNFRREVFNKTFPLIQGLTGSYDGNASFGDVGGTSTPLPDLPSRSIWNQQQVQEQVNNARAQGDTATATAHRRNTDDLAGRGFSQRSPLAMALQEGTRAAGMLNNTDAERKIRWDAAQGNAAQDLSVGGLAQKQWRDFNDIDVARRQAKVEAILNSQRNVASLISALAGLGG